jgi:probable rRNA maturation factor
MSEGDASMAGSPAVTVDIAMDSSLWEAVRDVEALVERAVEAALLVGGFLHREDAELSVVLTDDLGIQALNKAWRLKDQPTNVLSFPAVPPDRMAESPALGDLILAYETIDREAAELGIGIEAHLSHLVVHGTLHLFGYDHMSDADAERMETLEVAVLATLGIADPYAGEPSSRPAG